MQICTRPQTYALTFLWIFSLFMLLINIFFHDSDYKGGKGKAQPWKFYKHVRETEISDKSSEWVNVIFAFIIEQYNLLL